MCFFLSSRSGKFRVPYVNETIFIHSSGKSTLVVEILLDVLEELRSIDVIYPNTKVNVRDSLGMHRELGGYDETDDTFTVKRYQPEREELKGELRRYEVGELYADSPAHKEALDLIRFCIFTAVFERPVEPGTRTWVSLVFDSPEASQIRDVLLQKRYFTSQISGSLNTKRAFEQRCEEWLERVNSPAGYAGSPIQRETVTTTLEDLRTTIISSFPDANGFDVGRWYISIIPQPSISRFNVNIRDGDIQEIEQIIRPTVLWPSFHRLYHLPFMGESLSRITSIFDKTIQYSFYFQKNAELHPKFRLECTGVYEMPSLLILAILAALLGFLSILLAMNIIQ